MFFLLVGVVLNHIYFNLRRDAKYIRVEYMHDRLVTDYWPRSKFVNVFVWQRIGEKIQYANLCKIAMRLAKNENWSKPVCGGALKTNL